MIEAVGIIALIVGALAFYFGGNTTVALILVIAALVMAFVFGKPILGNPAGLSKLPPGVSPKDVKRYRAEHEGVSISEAVRACQK